MGEPDFALIVVYAPVMELRQDNPLMACLIEAQPTGPKCQANVGTSSEPQSCGAKMTRVDDWTHLCPTHGEMY